MFDRETLRMLALAIGIGTELVISTGIGFFAGYLLDKQVPEFQGWASVVLATLGLVFGCYRAFLSYKKLDRGPEK